MLARVCALQQQYGKTTAELETLVEGFSWVLSPYPMQKIINAIGEYVRNNTNIPTPADIKNIIDPPQEKLSPTLYIELKKKIREGYFPLSDERAFLRAYEDQEMGKVRGGSDELREAQLQIESHTMAIEYQD